MNMYERYESAMDALKEEADKATGRTKEILRDCLGCMGSMFGKLDNAAQNEITPAELHRFLYDIPVVK